MTSITAQFSFLSSLCPASALAAKTFFYSGVLVCAVTTARSFLLSLDRTRDFHDSVFTHYKLLAAPPFPSK